ncbi:MAG: ABC transporter substrate-binding protein [Ktedonobacterales bacterium]
MSIVLRSSIARLGIVVALGASMIVAGCSTGGGSGSNSTIGVGLQGPMTGSRADIGKAMTQASQMAIDIINKNGGVNGHQLKLYVQDDAGDQVDALPAVHTLINVDNVSTLIGPISLTEAAILPAVDQANITNMMWGGGSAFDAVTDPHFFRMSPSDTEQAQAMVYYAYKQGWTHVALAFDSSAGSQSLVAPIQQAAQQLNMTITNNVSFTPGQSNYNSEVQAIYNGHPQAVLGGMDSDTAGVLFGEIKQQGFNTTPFVATNIFYSTSFFQALGASIAAGPLYILNSSPTGGQGATALLSSMKQYYGYTTPPNGFEYTYDGLMTWAIGADEAGTTDWPKVEQGILAVTTNANNTLCTDYATCSSDIKAGKAVKFEGSASSVTFNKYHNVYGPFAVLQFNADGTTKQLATYSAHDIQGAFNSGS